MLLLPQFSSSRFLSLRNFSQFKQTNLIGKFSHFTSSVISGYRPKKDLSLTYSELQIRVSASSTSTGMSMSTDQRNNSSLLKRVAAAEKATDDGNKETEEVLKHPKRILVKKPWWQTALSVTVKFSLLLLFLAGMTRIVWNLKGEILSLRGEMNRFENKVEEMVASRLNRLDEKHLLFEKALGELNSKEIYSCQIDPSSSLDEIRALPRQVEEMTSRLNRLEALGQLNPKVICSCQLDPSSSLDEIRALARQVEEMTSRLNVLDEKYQLSLGQLNSKDLLSREDFAAVYEGFSKSRTGDSARIDPSLDELRALARQIVEQEIEKHAADGLGRVDYALITGDDGDAVVLDHSRPYERYPYRVTFNRLFGSDPTEKMLRPSFGEPGACYALQGTSGFAVVQLGATIIPEAITLEHVAKSVTNDRSDAPRDCRVFGWLRGIGPKWSVEGQKTLLAEFTYDLNKSTTQTYNVLDSASSVVVNIIKFEFKSNHGNPSHTCIYRIRVHGHEPA